MLFDTHAHYDDERFDSDRDELLSSMRDNNVGLILNSCSSLSDMDRIIPMIEKYDFMYASCGIHPHEVSDISESDIERLKEITNHPKVKAVGEIGLDYYYDLSPRDKQKKWFERQLWAAKEVGLPIIIHDRDAHKDTMDILRSVDIRDIGGVFHCYAGSKEMAKEILDWGMYIAFGGSLTFKKARQPIEVAEYVPLDRIVIETDCPYLTPEPNRGKRNSSLYIHYVLEKLAMIKGMTAEELEQITFQNGKHCFGIE